MEIRVTIFEDVEVFIKDSGVHIIMKFSIYFPYEIEPLLGSVYAEFTVEYERGV